jgi:hypothetical protein
VPRLALAVTTSGAVESVYTSPYTVSVESLLPADSTAADTASIRAEHPPLDIPQQFRWRVALGYLLALAFLAGVAWWLYRRSKRPRAGLPSFVTAAPVRPPDIVALETLDAIESRGYVGRALFKPHYSEVMDAIRTYIEGRYRVEAMDRTSFELMAELSPRRLPEGQRTALARMLDDADLVKFAKYVPEESPAREFLNRARRWVRETTPGPAAGAEASEPVSSAGGTP